jgi:hypothetical protein
MAAETGLPLLAPLLKARGKHGNSVAERLGLPAVRKGCCVIWRSVGNGEDCCIAPAEPAALLLDDFRNLDLTGWSSSAIQKTCLAALR